MASMVLASFSPPPPPSPLKMLSLPKLPNLHRSSSPTLTSGGCRGHVRLRVEPPRCSTGVSSSPPPPPPPSPKSSPKRSVYVTFPQMIPLGYSDPMATPEMIRSTATSLAALAAEGVQGVILTIHWGIVETVEQGVCHWDRYLRMVELAGNFGLKVQVILAFHASDEISLPIWLREHRQFEASVYRDRFRRSKYSCLSLGAYGVMNPVGMYRSFMENFQEAFRPFLGTVITGVQLGIGPDGECRYDSDGEFQVFDEGMLKLFHMHCYQLGVPSEWSIPENLVKLCFDFVHNKPVMFDYGHIFLKWYASLLIAHMDVVCFTAKSTFGKADIDLSLKIGLMFDTFNRSFRTSELTAGYLNLRDENSYPAIMEVLARHTFHLCCAGFDLLDKDEVKQSSPQGLLREILSAGYATSDLKLFVENSRTTEWDNDSFQAILVNCPKWGSKITFHFKMEKANLFTMSNWVPFTNFLRQLS